MSRQKNGANSLRNEGRIESAKGEGTRSILSIFNLYLE